MPADGEQLAVADVGAHRGGGGLQRRQVQARLQRQLVLAVAAQLFGVEDPPSRRLGERPRLRHVGGAQQRRAGRKRGRAILRLRGEKEAPLEAAPERDPEELPRPHLRLQAAGQRRALHRLEVEVAALPVDVLPREAQRGPHAADGRPVPAQVDLGMREHRPRAAAIEVVAQAGGHFSLDMEAVLGLQKTRALIREPEPAAFQGVDGDLRREPGMERPGDDEDVQLVGKAGHEHRQLVAQAHPVELRPGRGKVGRGHHLVGELLQVQLFGEGLELLLQLRLVEHLLRHAQVHLQPQRLEDVGADEGHLVEVALVEVGDDLIALHSRLHGGEDVAGDVQEVAQALGHARGQLGAHLRSLGKVEHAAVHVVDQRDVSVEDEQRPVRCDCEQDCGQQRHGW